ncbi:MAG: hypothetical protein AB8E82_12985 [Aureispira sp.]
MKDWYTILSRMEPNAIYPDMFEDLELSEIYTMEEANLIVFSLNEHGFIDMNPNSCRGQGRITPRGLIFLKNANSKFS